MGLLLAVGLPEAAANVDIDAAVVTVARLGDARAFSQIVDHYDRRLRGLAYHLLGDRDRMDDVLQEVYVKAFRALPQFKGDASLGTWLFRITHNACVDELRRGHKVLPLFEHGSGSRDQPSQATGPDGIATGRPDLAQALAALAPDQRATVLLVDAYGFDYDEAATVLGVRVGTIGSRLTRARASLRRALRSTNG